MNIKIAHCILFAFLLISHKANGQGYQLSGGLTPAASNYAKLSRSVFSCGVGTFLKESFNAPTYPQDFLPYNFLHLVELLEYGIKHNKDALYIRSVLRLFSNKIKACSYIDAMEAFPELLAQLPPLLEPYFVINADRVFTSLKDIVYHIQYQHFKEMFPQFKINPESFLENLAEHIENAAELRRLMQVFLEITLSKLIWHPEDQFKTWQNVKMIADQLAALYKKTIITDQEDLNSLYIALIERYCFFLEVAAPYINIKTFEQIRQDMHTTYTPLLDLEEQEDMLETKAQRLTRCLLELEAKARARESGIVIS